MGLKRERSAQTESLSSLIQSERSRIMTHASTERREQMQDAECRRAVYTAWNTVVSSTREGKHVTGLHYLVNTNELLVYTDSAAWTQELSMMREIIRSRMSVAGVTVENILFKTSREGYVARGCGEYKSSSQKTSINKKKYTSPQPSPEVSAFVASQTASITNDRLRESLKKAMEKSLSVVSDQKEDKER